MMKPASEVDWTAVKYIPEKIQVPHYTGFWLKFILKLAELPGIGSLIVNHHKNENKIDGRHDLFQIWLSLSPIDWQSLSLATSSFSF